MFYALYATINVVSDFCSYVDDICALLGYYASHAGNTLSTFRGNPSVLKVRPIFCPETSVRNYHHTMRNFPEYRCSYIDAIF